MVRQTADWDPVPQPEDSLLGVAALLDMRRRVGRCMNHTRLARRVEMPVAVAAVVVAAVVIIVVATAAGALPAVVRDYSSSRTYIHQLQVLQALFSGEPQRHRAR